jgi:hypothetical protein
MPATAAAWWFPVATDQVDAGYSGRLVVSRWRGANGKLRVESHQVCPQERWDNSSSSGLQLAPYQQPADMLVF